MAHWSPPPQQKCPMLLIAGVTTPKSESATEKSATVELQNQKAAGNYLGGVKEDMRNMEDYVVNSKEFKLKNTVRDMESLECEKVIHEIVKLLKKGHGQKVGIYYSGHGDENGSWCFADGELEWSKIKDLIRCGNIRIFCDSCFSGNWAQRLEELEDKTMNVYIFAASYPEKYAIDSRKGGKATVEWLKLLPFIFEDKHCSTIEFIERCNNLYGCIGHIDSDGDYTYHEFRDAADKSDDYYKSSGRCLKGHRLKLLKTNQLSYSTKTFGCNGCFEDSSTQGFKCVYHCSKCEYDLCKGCYEEYTECKEEE